MKRFLGYTAAAVIGLALVAGAANAFGPGRGPGDGPPCAAYSGEMGPGGGMGMGMGFGRGHGHGPMGRFGGPGAGGELDLTVDQARDLLEARLIWHGNDRLKVGSVEEQDAETIVAEILTVDDSLVRRVEVNRDNGAIRPAR